MKYILFGAGTVGKRILNMLGDEKVAYFCDSKMTNEYVDGIRVISKEQLLDLHAGYTVVVSVEKKEAVEEISYWLKSQSIPWINVLELFARENIDNTKAKHGAEFEYWQMNFGENKRDIIDSYYREIILSVAEESDTKIFDNKVVADFGCGPRGSLTWIDNARERIGIDVLSKEYLNEFGTELISHNMIYVNSNEHFIPIPSNYIDCMVTINSLDHVSNLSAMCSEIKRVLKPNGLLLGSFNLFEPATECEPQTLTEDLLKTALLSDFEIDSYRLSKMDGENIYNNIKMHNYIEKPDGSFPCILWIKGRKKAAG